MRDDGVAVVEGEVGGWVVAVLDQRFFVSCHRPSTCQPRICVVALQVSEHDSNEKYQWEMRSQGLLWASNVH